jgi:hypothetical protein
MARQPKKDKTGPKSESSYARKQRKGNAQAGSPAEQDTPKPARPALDSQPPRKRAPTTPPPNKPAPIRSTSGLGNKRPDKPTPEPWKPSDPSFSADITHTFHESVIKAITPAFKGGGMVKLGQHNEDFPEENLEHAYCCFTLRQRGDGLVLERHFGNSESVRGNNPWKSYIIAGYSFSSKNAARALMQSWSKDAEQECGQGKSVAYPIMSIRQTRQQEQRSAPKNGDILYKTKAYIGAADMQESLTRDHVNIPFAEPPQGASQKYCMLSMTFKKEADQQTPTLEINRHFADASSDLSNANSWGVEHVASLIYKSNHKSVKVALQQWEKDAEEQSGHGVEVTNYPNQSGPA